MAIPLRPSEGRAGIPRGLPRPSVIPERDELPALPLLEEDLPLPPPAKEPPKAAPRRRRAASPPPEEKPLQEWRTDAKTGKRYKTLPPTTWTGGGGYSECHIEEVDGLYDLNSAATTYLAHLQVPPSKEEQKRLQEERNRQLREQNAAYEQVILAEEAEEAKRVNL